MTHHVLTAIQAILAVCPVAPPGAQAQVDTIMGYLLWGIGITFGVAAMTGVGAVAAGRIFAMPHASKMGVISIVVVFMCVIGYLVLPGMVAGAMGTGCVGLPGPTSTGSTGALR